MKMRKVISLVLCLAICMSICANFSLVQAADATLDSLTFTLSSDGTYYLVAAKDKNITGEVVIPDYYEGLPVSQIAADGFRDCAGITKVTLPDTIVRIGSGSFYYASALEEINIPYGVKYIGRSAFTNCEKLTSVTIPESVTHLGQSAFTQSGLESIVIPDSVVYDDIRNSGGTNPFTAESLFNSCASLKTATLPSNITAIGKSAFSWCENLESIVIPDGVKTIGANAFSWCGKLENIVIPNSVTTIGTSAFAGCSKLINVYIPDSVESMSKSAFSTYSGGGDYRLASISLPGGISLKDTSTITWSMHVNHIFYRGTQEQFNETLETVDEGSNSSISQVSRLHYETVHFNCTGEETYTLVENLAVHCLISGPRIYNCSVCGTVHDIKIGGYGDHILAEDGTCTMCGEGIEDSSQYLSFTRPSGADYYSVSGCDVNATGAIVIPEEHAGLPVKSIGVSAFKGCTKITSVYIPDSVEYIRNYAFYNCTSLKAIILPSSIKQMGGTRSSFSNCDSLEVVYITDLTAWCNIDFPSYTCNPLYTGAGLYLWGQLVEDVVIPENVTTLKPCTFAKYQALKSVTFHDGIEEIGKRAFFGCSNLTEINIPDVPVKIREEAFKSCGYYKNTDNWEDNILYIGNHLIESDSDSQEITVKDGTVTVADHAFYGAPDFVKVLNFPESLIRIGDYSFYGACGLNEINFGRYLKYIGAHAFEGTYELDELNFNDRLISIGDYAFAYSGFYKVVFPHSLTEFNPSAFSNTENISVIKCSYNNPAFVAVNNVLFTKDKTKLLLSTKNPTEDYVVPEETRVIEDYAFMLLDDKISVTLHDNLERIGKDAFEYTKYTAYNSHAYYIGNYLIGAYDVTDLTVREGTLGIADDSLHDVASLVIPESLRFIGDSLEHIGRIDIPSVESWCNMDLQHPEASEVHLRNVIYIYMNNARLTEIEIPYSVKTLKAYRFGDCSTLKKVIINPSVTTIEDNAFYNFSEDLVIHGLRGGVANDYADANSINFVALDVCAKPNARIDYTENVIYTDVYNLKNLYQIVDLGEADEIHLLGSIVSNGVHLWGTGSTITVYNNQKRVDYTVVITGDSNGDGVCDVMDASQLSVVINNLGEFEGCYEKAADINGDGAVDVNDYSQVVNILGRGNA